MKREAKITPEIEKYIRLKCIYGLIEVKQTRARTLNFSSFESHQLTNLIAAIDDGVIHKLSDADPRLKPGDIISLPPIMSWVVIKFPSATYFIQTYHIQKLMRERAKGISEEIAKRISTYILLK